MKRHHFSYVCVSLKVKAGVQSSLVCEAEEQDCVLEQPVLGFLFVCLFCTIEKRSLKLTTLISSSF